MPRLFGTDGVRGLANREVTAEMALSLAQAAAHVLGDGPRVSGRRPVAVLARDPRISGEFISAAVAAGLAGSGVDVLDAGVIPTPAAAYLIADIGADFGVVISASHNPAPDNGIKVLGAGGAKLTDEIEDRIEAAMSIAPLAPIGADVGRIDRFADAEDRYVVHLLGALPHRLDGLKIVLDCANGAAAGVSPEVFTDAGAELIVIGNDPDGLNINDGVGSTHLGPLAKAVLEHGADAGIAHDGDADRCLAVDAAGNVVDGDQIMAILAIAMKSRGVLKDDTLVTTVMSNLGLRRAMQREGIRVLETRVGDRYVLEALGEGGYSLGGEQSGHVILTAHATTGDGLLTGLSVMAEVARTGRSLAELASAVTIYPQVMINVRDVDRARTDDAGLLAAVAEAEALLGDTGRVLLRPSGTEPVVRVMVEAADSDTAGSVAASLAEVVRERLALAPAS
jgi:phosphoglucosamine mutase